MTLSAWGVLRRAVSRHRARMVAAMGCLTVWQACETAVPLVIGMIVDHAVLTGDLTALVWWLLGFAVMFACLSFGYRFGARLGLSCVQSESHQLRLEIAEHVLSSKGSSTKLSSGEVLSLATADADRVGAGLRMLATGFAWLVALVVATVILVRINPVLGLAVVAGSVLLLVVIRLLTPRISRHAEAQQSTVAAVAGMASDFVQGLRPLKGIGGEQVAISRYRAASSAARDAGIRTARSTGELEGASTALSGIFLAAIALLAGHFAAQGEISIGDLIAVVGVGQFLAEPLGALGRLGAQAAGAHASAARIATFLATGPAIQDGHQDLPTPEGHAPHLQVVDLHGSAADGLDLQVSPGETVAVVTTDPAVAEDLVRALGGADPSMSGTVLLDQVPLEQLRLAGRRDRLVVNPHHSYIFDGTIADNITRRDLPADRIQQVVDASAVSDLQRLFTDGLDHPTTSGGSTLSGGQRQRVALARALAADPPLLVLHDPTTAVDSVTEQRIGSGLRQVRHGRERSTLLLTTSPALLAVADRVVLVRAGRVAAQGTHAELLQDQGYRAAVLR